MRRRGGIALAARRETFFGLTLLTLPGRVMTPRSTSEALVREALVVAGHGAVRVADVGTGSGALAVALAATLPDATVVATDTSLEAVNLARANAARLGLAERVTVLEGDLLEPTSGRFDLVVANLPYLPHGEAASDPDLLEEPQEAVAGPGDGLGAYRRLLATSRSRLERDGALLIQLRRRVLVARRGEIAALERALGQLRRPAPQASMSVGRP